MCDPGCVRMCADPGCVTPDVQDLTPNVRKPSKRSIGIVHRNADLRKPAPCPTNRTAAPIKADYVGFTIHDVFVVGYGIDYAEKYRCLPYLAYGTGAG